MKNLMFIPSCYHKKYSVCFLNYSLNEQYIITLSTFHAWDKSLEFMLHVSNNVDCCKSNYIVHIFIKNYRAGADITDHISQNYDYLVLKTDIQ